METDCDLWILKITLWWKYPWQICSQKDILQAYARQKGFLHPEFFVDDGISGTTFERPSFQRMQRMAEAGEISTIIVKDDCVILELNSESP